MVIANIIQNHVNFLVWILPDDLTQKSAERRHIEDRCETKVESWILFDSNSTQGFFRLPPRETVYGLPDSFWGP